MEVWFSNTATIQRCERWDSNNGNNYDFALLTPPGWVGSPTALVTRASGHPCEGGAPLQGSLRFDTWARTRAVLTNVCFQVWKQGVTDRDNPNLWRELDVQVRYRYDDGPFQTTHVSFVDRAGNNARYAMDLRAMDPMRPYTCTGAPIESCEQAPNGPPCYDTARMEFYFTVNGAELRPEGGGAFLGIFEDYANDPWRAANCQ
jgi:hypothetical protein